MVLSRAIVLHNGTHTGQLKRNVFFSQDTISVSLYSTCPFKNCPESSVEYGREKDPCENS